MQPDHAHHSAARLRHALFVTCLACTLWLVVQNSILLALLPGFLASHGPPPSSAHHARTEARHD